MRYTSNDAKNAIHDCIFLLGLVKCLRPAELTEIYLKAIKIYVSRLLKL